MRRLPTEVLTLYAELLDQLTAREARRSIGQAAGGFVTKTIKGQEYLYFQHSQPGGTTRQIYLGRRTASLDKVIERFGTERAEVEEDRSHGERLCAELRVGGAAVVDTAAARVIEALADAAVFRLGGVLVGTHAFIALGNMLGVRWEHGLLRTDDVDIAGERVLAVVVPGLETDVPSALESLQMGFLPVPGLSATEPSTSFKVRGKPLRVDLLTPQRHGEGGPVTIPRFRAAAQPLAYLDYLIEDPQPAAIVAASGVLVQVPSPARFAIHKLIVARSRPAAMQARSDKDLRQAADLIVALAEDRPADLVAAREAAERRGKSWRKLLVEGADLLARRSPEAAELLKSRR